MSCYFAVLWIDGSVVCCFGDVRNLPPPDLPPLDSATTLYHRYDRYELDICNLVHPFDIHVVVYVFLLYVLPCSLSLEPFNLSNVSTLSNPFQ